MWDEIAHRYYFWSLSCRWYYYRLALELRKIVKNPEFILDVGSGPGILAEELKNLFPDSKIVCLDSSLEMCRFSKGIRGEATFLPFKDETFDLVIFCFSLHEFEIQKALEEAKRVLKKNGLIFIVDLNIDCPEAIKTTLKLILGKIIGFKYFSHLEKAYNEFESCEKLLDRFIKMKFEVKWNKGLHEIMILAKKI